MHCQHNHQDHPHHHRHDHHHQDQDQDHHLLPHAEQEVEEVRKSWRGGVRGRNGTLVPQGDHHDTQHQQQQHQHHNHQQQQYYQYQHQHHHHHQHGKGHSTGSTRYPHNLKSHHLNV